LKPATLWPAAAVALLLALARPASAIPVFANGQGGVTCELCHTAPPNLNAYGRYVYASNFTRGLDSHSQMVQNAKEPLSLQVSANGSNEPDPGLPKTYAGIVGLISAGYLGKDVTYYASVPIVEGGFPATQIDQLWAAYNGFSAGNGSLQIGKFPTPVLAPWTSQSLSLSGYALAEMPVGLNTVGLGDNRWGASYSQIGKGGLIGNVAYVSNTGAVEGAYNSAPSAGGEGQSYVASVMFVNPDAHFTGGVAVLNGNFPLPSGAKDTFNRQMALLSYSTSDKISFDAMAVTGHDNNPNDGATGPSGSNGVSLETIYNPVSWAHLNLRYERTNDGLGSVGNNYVTDLAFNPLPNLILTLENVSSVGARPVMSYQLLWAGPWVRPATRRAPVVPAAIQSGQRIYVANCTSCHGAAGQGGEGADLRKIGTSHTQAQVVAIIESPSGLMPHLYPGTLSVADVDNVATYIRATFH
jgi:cytochrome c553